MLLRVIALCVRRALGGPQERAQRCRSDADTEMKEAKECVMRERKRGGGGGGGEGTARERERGERERERVCVCVFERERERGERQTDRQRFDLI